MDIQFKSLNDLYIRIKPALVSKCVELHRYGANYIKEEDIWNFFKETKWGKASDLSLSEMVNDVLNGDNYQIESFVKKKVASIHRDANLDETES
jgi:hypothetical protein